MRGGGSLPPRLAPPPALISPVLRREKKRKETMARRNYHTVINVIVSTSAAALWVFGGGVALQIRFHLLYKMYKKGEREREGSFLPQEAKPKKGGSGRERRKKVPAKGEGTRGRLFEQGKPNRAGVSGGHLCKRLRLDLSSNCSTFHEVGRPWGSPLPHGHIPVPLPLPLTGSTSMAHRESPGQWGIAGGPQVCVWGKPPSGLSGSHQPAEGHGGGGGGFSPEVRTRGGRGGPPCNIPALLFRRRQRPFPERGGQSLTSADTHTTKDEGPAPQTHVHYASRSGSHFLRRLARTADRGN
ncbi:UNVERIFIED_CONTAM: hypothetical protein K2H54_034259 [Gekko kuhli]